MNYDALFESNCIYELKAKDVPYLKDYLIKKAGWIYIAHSKNNDLLKIGRTSKNPLIRAKTLSSTGVLHDYEILFSLNVYNQFLVEKKVHHKLKKYRVSKEFFSVSKEAAILAIKEHYELEKKMLSRFLNLSVIDSDIDLLDTSIF